METISQMASTAAKYAFGDGSTNEPESGRQGDVSKGEPYDAGNLDSTTQDRDNQDFNASDAAYTTQSKSSDGTYTSTNNPDGQGVSKSENTGPITTATNHTDDSGFTHPQHDMSGQGRERDTSGQDAAGGVTTSTNRTNDNDFTSPGQDMGGDKRTSSTQDDKAGAKDSKQTSSSSKLPDPSEDEEAEVDTSGPGPRDVATVARENGGDAGNVGHSKTDKTDSEQTEKKADDNNNNDDDDNKGGKSEGTGELYVKSTGLQADGGDFDATKPGAGREADRLMEEKGLGPAVAKKNDKKDDSGSATQPSGSDDKEKVGLIGKIKDKLHKH